LHGRLPHLLREKLEGSRSFLTRACHSCLS
jgi:hypothetical protein